MYAFCETIKNYVKLNVNVNHHVLVSLSFNFPLSDEGYQIIKSSQTACVGLTTIRLFTSVLLTIS